MHLARQVQRKEPESAPGERGVSRRERPETVEHDVGIYVSRADLGSDSETVDGLVGGAGDRLAAVDDVRTRTTSADFDDLHREVVNTDGLAGGEERERRT
jgi:hypothetical protein